MFGFENYSTEMVACDRCGCEFSRRSKNSTRCAKCQEEFAKVSGSQRQRKYYAENKERILRERKLKYLRIKREKILSNR